MMKHRDADSERASIWLKWIVALSVVMLGVGGAVWVMQPDRAGQRDNAASGTAPGIPVTTVASSKPPDDLWEFSPRARELESAVNSRETEQLAQVVVLDPDLDIEQLASAALPVGAVFSIDDSTFEVIDPDFAVATGMITGSVSATVTVFLVQEHGNWLIAGTTLPEEK